MLMRYETLGQMVTKYGQEKFLVTFFIAVHNRDVSSSVDRYGYIKSRLHLSRGRHKPTNEGFATPFAHFVHFVQLSATTWNYVLVH